MTNKVLTIVIPVYNGGDRISDTIESVVRQLPGYKDNVEFMVRDNCSSDNTEQVIRKYMEIYPGYIRYEKRNQTTSADINFIESIHLASGDYVLLLGDDDLLLPYFIEYTLKAIKEYPNVGLVYFNRLSTSIEYKGLKICHKDPNSYFQRYYDDMYSFLNEHIPGPNFISVNVFRKEVFIKNESFIKENHYGYLIFGALLKGLSGESCLYYFMPGVLQRNPRQRAWLKEALLYNSTGLKNIFNDLDSTYPGIASFWKRYDRIYVYLPTVALNRPLYEEKWQEIKINLNLIQKILYRIFLYIPFAAIMYKKVGKMVARLFMPI